ncbi:MAG: LLM class flavin-dependent oxidoreductase [Chloroflexota bacterium]|nr:LLM class flavin-dependent oxidoreductase [Chloroflexota bacterium]
MEQQTDSNVGVMFRRDNAPEALPDFARRAKQLGFKEVWVVEDCFYASAIASAAVALACTQTICVGIGIMPAVARNAAFTAMEIATLARIYPGRFVAGIGHGMADWMKQIGAFPKSQLAALGETAAVVRGLLAGESVTFHGEEVQIENVKLEFPPAQVPPVILGVRGPKSLQVAGRSADGAMLAELSSPAYVRWAREQIAQGQADAGRSAPIQLAVYMLCAVDADGNAARQRLRPLIAEWLSFGQADYVRALGIEAAVNNLIADGGRARLQADLPDEWIDQMAVVGTPNECRASIRRLIDAGATSVILVPEQAGISALEGVAGV